MRSASKPVKKAINYIVTMAVSAMVVFILAGIIFPRPIYDSSIPIENIVLDAQTELELKTQQSAQQNMETGIQVAINENEPLQSTGSSPVQITPETKAQSNDAESPGSSASSDVKDGTLPVISGSVTQQTTQKSENEQSIYTNEQDEKPALNLNAEPSEPPYASPETSSAPQAPEVSETPDASAQDDQDTLQNTDKDSIEQPPSVLDIISRSIFSYKTLLSREMPFIYGTEYIAQDIDSLLDEQETAPEEMPEEIQLEINKIKSDEEAPSRVITGGGAQVLIYHTHTLEAFRQVKGSEYVESSRWRTKDQSKSVVKLGELLQQELEKFGFDVLHDKTNHEPPELNTSYSRSLATMKKYVKNNKTLRVFIDLHRDASSNKNDVVMVDGKRCARIMFVVGMGKSSSIKPDWKDNFKLAQTISKKMNEITPNFAKDVRLKEIRSYNQYMTDTCMLIEVGHNANTLEEAENTIPYLAKALSEVIKIKK